MVSVRCPTCSKTGEIARLDDLPTFPFCSERCRLIDLGRWIDGAYAIPEDRTGSPAATSPADPIEDEEE